MGNLKLPAQSDHIAAEVGRILMEAIETTIFNVPRADFVKAGIQADIYQHAMTEMAETIELGRKGVALEEMLTKGGQVGLKKKVMDIFDETAAQANPWEWMVNKIGELVLPEYSQTQATKIESQQADITTLLELLTEIEELHGYYLEHDKLTLKRIATVKEGIGQ